ncbi:MAG: helix-turn-helix transcriptional regulator [Bacillota bacterium]|nr:helix-turn-helix transcriptional regulator [Bacillota bacterium]
MIRVKREAKGLTQCQLATAMGVDQTAVSQWERGETLPRADRLPDLAKILGCTIDQLLDKSTGSKQRK